MRQIDIMKRSVGNALDIVRYLEGAKLIPKERAKTMKRNILDTNTDFVSTDKDMSYWTECQRAHVLEEITDEDLLSVADLAAGESDDDN